jgi:hypothetical protein
MVPRWLPSKLSRGYGERKQAFRACPAEGAHARRAMRDAAGRPTMSARVRSAVGNGDGRSLMHRASALNDRGRIQAVQEVHASSHLSNPHVAAHYTV